MSENRKLMRGGLVLSIGNALSQVLSLVRNLIVARLVTPDDFGVAVTFALTLSVLEAAFAHGFDKLLIQDEDGEDEMLQSMLHCLLLLRGVVICAIIFFAAPWIALLFDIPEAKSAYQILALVPLLRGLMHLDVKRIQRNMRFTPDLAVRLISQALGLVVAISYAWVFQDYWAMLWGVLVQVLSLTLLSHFFAVRRYSLGWNPQYSSRVIGFSGPLMINGIIMIFSDQGNRLLVGARLSVSNLAIFSAAAMPLEAGLGFLSQVAGDLSVPWLSAAKSDPKKYKRRHGLVGLAISVATLVVFAPLAMIGMEITTLIFGAQYAGSSIMMAWLALAFGLRFLRVWPIATAISLGDTRNLMLSNLARASGIFFAIALIEVGMGLNGAAIAMAMAEGLATLVAFSRIQKMSKEVLTPGWPYLTLVAMGFVITIAAAVLIDQLIFKIAFAAVFVLLTLGAVLLFEPKLWRSLLGSFGTEAP